MGQIDELWRYDGRRVVVTGCASGIGEHVARQLAELGAEVVGLDIRAREERDSEGQPALQLKEFHEVNLADPASIDQAAASIGGQVDALFNVAGVSSGHQGSVTGGHHQLPRHPAVHRGAGADDAARIGDRQRVVAGRIRLSGECRRHRGTAGHRDMAEGVEWCQRNPEALADGGGYRLSKEAIILYGLANVAVLGAKGIRINCTAPGVTDTPILDQLRSAYGQEFLDAFRTPLGSASSPPNRRRCWCS